MRALMDILHRHYGLQARDIVPLEGGWSALAFRVSTTDGRTFFLKMYEKNRASTPKWTALIDQYVPVLHKLGDEAGLRGRLPVPILTADGRCTSENEEGIFLLYAHIDGDTVGSRELTNAQAAQLGDMLACLHGIGEEALADMPGLDLRRLKENFSLPFLPPLRETVNERLASLSRDVRETLAPYADSLNAIADALDEASVALRRRPLRFVLCHTDLHNWNLMTSGDRLMLIDWEGLRLAPAEADWMFVADGPHASVLLDRYRMRHPGFVPDPDLLRFYRRRRRLEDIWEFAEQLLFDSQGAPERSHTLDSLRRELEELSNI